MEEPSEKPNDDIKTREITTLVANWEPNLEEELFELNIPFTYVDTDHGSDLVVDFCDALCCIRFYNKTQKKLTKFGRDLQDLIEKNEHKFNQVIFQTT